MSLLLCSDPVAVLADRHGLVWPVLHLHSCLCLLLLPAVSALSGDTTDFLARSAKVQWGLMLTVYCLSHAPALMLLQIPGYEGQSLMLLLYLLLVVQLSDVLQYVFGKLFGKHLLAPRSARRKPWKA